MVDTGASSPTTDTSAVSSPTEDLRKVKIVEQALCQYFDAVNDELKTPTSALLHTGLTKGLASDIARHTSDTSGPISETLLGKYPYISMDYVDQICTIIEAVHNMHL